MTEVWRRQRRCASLNALILFAVVQGTSAFAPSMPDSVLALSVARATRTLRPNPCRSCSWDSSRRSSSSSGSSSSSSNAVCWGSRRDTPKSRLSASGTVAPPPLSRFRRTIDALTNAFPFWVLAAGALGLFAPSTMAGVSSDAITAMLAVSMVCMGATLRIEDFKAVAQRPKPVVVGTVAQYTIMPLMGVISSRLWRLPPPLAAGVILVSTCPGGTASNLVALIAEADVALSVAMTTVSTLLAAVVTPLLTRTLVGGVVDVSAKALAASTVQVVFAPVALGLALNTYLPKLTEKAAPFTPLLCVGLVALICGSVVAQNAAALLTSGPQLVAAVATLHLGGFFWGYVLTRLFGYPEKSARTISIEVGMQNSALAVVLAQRAFPDPLSALPGAVSATAHSVIGSTLAAAWRLGDQRRDKRDKSKTR